MRKILLPVIVMVTNISFGQNFPRNDVNVLLNRDIKVLKKMKPYRNMAMTISTRMTK